MFGDMMARIAKGEAQGIIAGKIDRWLAACGRRPNPVAFAEWKYCSYSNARPQLLPTADNVLMMSVELGMATDIFAS